MTRAQENFIERLALTHGRVYVRDGYADQNVRATVPSGRCSIVNPDGHEIKTEGNFSIDWRQQA